MDRLEIALREYRRICPPASLGANAQQSDELERWLRDLVVPVVEDLQRNSSRFRRLVEWAPKQFAPDSNSAEQAALKNVENALVDAAAAVLTVVREADLWSSLGWKHQEEGVTTKPASEASENRITSTSIQQIAVERAAQRAWFDLVSLGDYLRGQVGLQLREPNDRLSIAFNENYRQGLILGDHITRWMIERVDFWFRHVESAWKCTFSKVSQKGQDVLAWVDKLFSVKVALDRSMKDLRKKCLEGEEARLRNACCALLQIYVAYHPKPLLEWLGIPPDWIDTSGPMIRACARPSGTEIVASLCRRGRFRPVRYRKARLMDMKIIEQVVAAVNDVGKLYRQAADPEREIEEAIEKHLLVVVENPRTAFWKGQRVDVDWNAQSQASEFLLHLASNASQMKGVDRYSLGRELTGRDLSVRKHKLCSLLRERHGDLASRIKKVRGGQCYLDLEPHEVKVLDLDGDAWILDPTELEAMGGLSAMAEDGD